MSTLTNTYIHNVTRHLVEDDRDDIAQEIAMTVSDMVEARLGDLEDVPDANVIAVERQVLEELGDPAELSRQYSNSPQYLIGPNSYPLFLWCLRWVLPFVAFASLMASGIAHVMTTDNVQVGSLIGVAIGNTVTALLTAFAAVTILLALGDRAMTTESSKALLGQAPRKWTVDQLKTTDPAVSSLRADAILGLVFIILLALIPLLPTTLFYVGHLNGGEPFINPDLAPGWMVGYWLLLALMAIVEIVRLVRRTRSLMTTVSGSVIDVIMAVFLTIALLTQQVLHPELTTAAGAEFQQVLTVVAIWAIVVWDQISTVRSYRAHRRSMLPST